MTILVKRSTGALPEQGATDEVHWMNRRAFIGTAAAGLMTACTRPADPDQIGPLLTTSASPLASHYPARRNPKYQVHRDLTAERVAATYNNFYEFTTAKDEVWRRVRDFDVYPWTLSISGLCDNPGRVDVDALVKRFPIEERVYRFRCVEAWAMVVPWTGFALADLMRWAQPKSNARFVRFVTAERPNEMPNLKAEPWFPWPYFEALSLAEATNELAFMATGIYGRELPKQHGAPIRLVTPWKYGFKNIKSIVSIEFVAERPSTFWNSLAPDEYDFLGNVRPDVAHPRWSQASERMIGTGERRPTLPYNGYQAQVAGLYQ